MGRRDEATPLSGPETARVGHGVTARRYEDHSPRRQFHRFSNLHCSETVCSTHGRLGLTNVKTSHHAAILVLEVVAVEEISSFVLRKSHRYFHLVTHIQRDCVFQARLIQRHRITISSQDLKIREVQVNRVDDIMFIPK